LEDKKNSPKSQPVLHRNKPVSKQNKIPKEKLSNLECYTKPNYNLNVILGRKQEINQMSINYTCKISTISPLLHSLLESY
jgi:hypothetical protein